MDKSLAGSALEGPRSLALEFFCKRMRLIKLGVGYALGSEHILEVRYRVAPGS